MIRLTDEQAAAAFAVEPSLAIVAGAGTGKTRVLTERYLHLVLERDVAMTRILALTFTEKAAREMKDRIFTALADRGRRELAHATEFAPISTVHSFLAKVLRERALDADVDPRFAIADEIMADLLLEQALAAMIENLEPELRGTLAGMAGGEEYLLSLYGAARATPFALADLQPVTLDLADLRARTRHFLDGCEGVEAAGRTGERLRGLRALAPRLWSTGIDTELGTELDAEFGTEPGSEFDAAGIDVQACEEFAILVGGNVAKAQRELFQEGKALRGAWRSLRNAEQAGRVGSAIVVALQRLDEQYRLRKDAEGVLDFADLERIGLTLLLGPAGGAVAAEFDHLLVDEYQDTSRIQQALLDALAKRCDRFGVGDEKQSIYRFRHADAAVFRELQAHARVYPLSGSFRSRPELVEFNNALFARLFRDRDVTPHDLHVAAEWRGKSRPSVEWSAPASEHAARARRIEAGALARRLREIVSRGELTLTNAAREEQPLRYRHCALLMRTTTHLGLYERALADEGVPYVVVKGRGYYAAREVVDLAHLLLLLDDPGDAFRAVAVMGSLFCGVTPAVLAQLRGDDEARPLVWCVREAERPEGVDAESWDRLRLFADRYDGWRALAGRVSTGDLIETILDQTRVADLMLLEPDGRRRHANLHKALRRARLTAEDPVSFARSLLDFRERERRESEAPIASDTDEAVRIMTVHASKGLEFPLVAVADLTAPRKAGSGPILTPDGVFGFRLRGEPDNLEPPGFEALKEWEGIQEENERLRLLYVAFTRAEEHLLLSGAVYPRCDTTLLDQLPEELRVDVALLVAGASNRRASAAVRGAIRRAARLPTALERDDRAADALLRRIEATSPPEPDATPYVAAVADLVEFRRCPRRYRLGRMLGLEVEEPEPDDAVENAGAYSGAYSGGGGSDEHPRRLLGTVFHEIMAEIKPGRVPDAECVRRHFPEATERDHAKLVQWSEWLAQTDLAGSLEGVEPRLAEMDFFARIGGLPVRGVIDLYVPSLPLLLDYKTGGAVRADEYAVQVAVYLAALRALGFAAPDRAHLVYVDAGVVVEVEEQPIEELVEEFRAAHRGSMSFAPTPGDACRYCDFRAACEANGVAVI